MHGVTQQDIFRLQITMDDLLLFQKVEGAQHLFGEAPDELDRETAEGIRLDELVEIHIKKLSGYAEMTAEVEAMREVNHAMLVLGILFNNC